VVISLSVINLNISFFYSIEPAVKITCKISLFDALESDTNFGVQVLAEEDNGSCLYQK